MGICKQGVRSSSPLRSTMSQVRSEAPGWLHGPIIACDMPPIVVPEAMLVRPVLEAGHWQG